MKRRQAIQRFALLTGGLTLSLAGIKLYKMFKRPDFHLLDDDRALLDELAETIIPQTDTPGAKEAGVGALIGVMVRDCTDKVSQNNFISGIEELKSYTQNKYGKSFQECAMDQKIAILSHFENEGRPSAGFRGKIQRKLLGASFFTTLKKYTILGYCTSKAGATGGLRYDYIPGKYIGSVPLTRGQRAWATQ